MRVSNVKKLTSDEMTAADESDAAERDATRQ
jgi:hypothetical protein